jgi:hypothetical protein
MLNPDNPLVKAVFHFRDGTTLSLHMPAPMPQGQAMPAIGKLCQALNLDFREVAGIGVDRPGEKWECGPGPHE